MFWTTSAMGPEKCSTTAGRVAGGILGVVLILGGVAMSMSLILLPVGITVVAIGMIVAIAAVAGPTKAPAGKASHRVTFPVMPLPRDFRDVSGRRAG
jgi:hypothetical protein